MKYHNKYTCHSEPSEESISKVLLPYKDSSVTSFPQNDVKRAIFTFAEVLLPHTNCQRKFAFTLAEVLITLGIIGVVAALTLPALVAKHQKMVLKQQFKKSYSMLTQSLNKVVADFGGYTPQCYYILTSNNSFTSGALTDECNAVRENLFKYIKIVKTCENKSFKNGCIPKYKGFDTMAVENNPDLSEEDAVTIVRGQPGFYENAILNTNSSYVLADGNIILDYGGGHFPQIFAIDINGKKGPNKWGYDLFSFWVASNEKRGYYLYPTTYFVEKGGLTTSEMVKEVNK